MGASTATGIADVRPAGRVTIPVVVQETPPGEDPEAGGTLLDARQRRSRGWLTWVALVAAVVLAAVAVRMFVVEAFSIPSGSMQPTLQVGERILVDKLAYSLRPVHRGDIVVFHRPAADPTDPPDLVKRVIGLPGETITVRHGRVVVDGRVLAEPWFPRPAPPTDPSPLPDAFSLNHPYRIPAGEYFVMGDNRTDSEDSRWFGPVPRGDIVGAMVLKAWPWSNTLWLVLLSAAAAVLVAALGAVLVGRPPGLRHRPDRH